MGGAAPGAGTRRRSPPRAAQVVLAAGRSERMGTPKALLELGGRTALERAVDAARGAGVETSVVTLGLHAPEILARHGGGLPPGVRWVTNPDPCGPMLSSVQIALRALDALARQAGAPWDAFFLHPVDVPLVRASDYRLLLDAFARERGGGGGEEGAPEVFVPSHGGRRGHPLLAAASVAARLLVLPPEATPRDVFRTARTCHVLTPNAGVLEDMDTPEDHRRLAAMLREPGE